MKRMIMVGIGCLLGGMTAFGAADAAFSQAKAVKVSGEVTVKPDGQEAFVVMQEGSSYSFGSTIKTGRASFADMEIAPQNSFRVQPASHVVLQKGIKSTVAMSLVSGTVVSTLDKFPKNMKYEVQTPLAVCGAVGTSYSVTFTVAADGTIKLEVVDSEGNVSILGKHVKLERGSKLKPGQSLAIELTKTPAGWSAKVIFIGKVGDSLWLNLWGIRTKLVIEKNDAATGVGAGTANATTTASVAVTILLPPYIDPLPGDPDKTAPPPPPAPPAIPVIPHDEASPSYIPPV